ncbi:ArsR family transcriptional regulator, partial [Rhodobacterales bacterium HKCCE2091]|nr:ArsR family transcriptional regulator [Rhodobacterales bacterium HKCCE2091]
PDAAVAVEPAAAEAQPLPPPGEGAASAPAATEPAAIEPAATEPAIIDPAADDVGSGPIGPAGGQRQIILPRSGN